MKTSKKNGKYVDQAARDFITGDDRKGLSHNIFVRAGAGAGKTHSIQHRVKNLFLHAGIKPENLAVITYTRKAAVELKDRIRAIMEETAAQGDSPDMRQKALEALDGLNKAKISTVHSFCFDLLKEYPVEFNIDPRSQIADERQIAGIEVEVIREFFWAEVNADPHFKGEFTSLRALRDEYPGSIGEAGLFRIFSLLYANRELTPRPFNTQGLKDLRVQHVRSAEKITSKLVEDIFVTIESEIEDTDDKLYQKCEEIRHFFGTFAVDAKKRDGIPHAVRKILSGTKSPFPGSKTGARKSYKTADFLKSFKERVQQFNEAVDGFRFASLTLCYNHIIETYPAYKTIYSDFKRREGLLDFADCLILLRDGLRDSAALRDAVKRRFSTLIVDEFQDSDPLQAEILFYLAAEKVGANESWRELKPTPGMLVFVGDPKQSIYGFKRADIAIYLEVMTRIIKSDKEADRFLSTNFRSNEGIVSFVNEHFSQIIKKNEIERLASPDYEKMTPKATDDSTDPRVLALDVSLELSSDQPGSEGVGKRGLLTDEKRRREAWLVGNLIKQQIDKGTRKPGDFLVLFRKTAGMFDYENAFDLLEIPVVNTKTRSFLQSREVYPLLALLGVLVRPTDPHFIYALLRSRVFAYTDAELHTLFSKVPRDKLSLNTLAEIELQLKPISEAISGSEGIIAKFDKSCCAIQLYSGPDAYWRDSYISAALKLREILKSELSVNEFNESRILENLLGGALKRRGGWSTEDEMEEEKLILETERPSKVQLMTIHGAKGLEANCVIIANPESGTMKNLSTLVDRVKEEIVPVGEKIYGLRMADHPELQTQVDRELIFKEEEEKRILYVAATRPIEDLYIVRYADSQPGEFLAPLAELLGPKFPSIPLKIAENYRARFTPKSTKNLSPAPPITEPDFLTLQCRASQSINHRTVTSEAVTTTLKAEADEVFGNNTDGRERGMEFGKLTHEVLEAICLRAAEGVPTTEKDLALLLDSANSETYAFEIEEINQLKGAVSKFLKSPLYEKIRAADSILPEVAFKVKGKVHGVVDLLYRDNEGLHLIDWKSDIFTDPKRAEKVKAFYKKQIDAYVTALSVQLGQKIASQECVYLFKSIYASAASP